MITLNNSRYLHLSHYFIFYIERKILYNEQKGVGGILVEKEINLALKIKLANTYLTRLKGLLFHKQPLVKEGLLITPCNSVHMFFMRFSIDVVFLDSSNRIVKVVEDLKPWRIVAPVRGASKALELPVGTIKCSNMTVGDKIKL